MKTRINISYLHEILSYMIEGQYENLHLEDYRTYIQHYVNAVFSQRLPQKQHEFQEQLKRILKYLLNNPQIDYEAIFLEGAMHGMGDQERAETVLLMIWNSFFDDEEWKDPTFVSDDIELTDEPFEG